MANIKYPAIGLMSGSSLDGLDIILAEFTVENKRWAFRIKAGDCVRFPAILRKRLQEAIHMSSRDYMLLHTDFARWCGEKVNQFIEKNKIRRRADVIGSHGHTTFHMPERGMTHQLGDGATIAAVTGIPVVSDLRNTDVALGGQGAPIVPIGEKLLFPEHQFFLNIGGISNVSIHQKKKVIAFDVCPANRVLNLLANKKGKAYDKDGRMASKGKVDLKLLEKLNQMKYYSQAYPKSLPNSFGTDIIFPLLMKSGLSIPDALATYTEHIAMQIMKSLLPFSGKHGKILITGGGALNKHLINRIDYYLETINIEVSLPSEETINNKEALVMALIAVLRLRGEVNVLSSVTGSKRNNVSGALWQP